MIELIAISIFLKCNKERLDEKAPRKRCGYIFEDLNYRIRGGWALTFPILYQIRFALLAMTAVFMGEYLVYQTLIVVVSTIAIIAVLGFAHPFSIVWDNYTKIASESVIIFIMDLLLFSSNPTVDTMLRKIFGFCMIGTLGISLLFS